MSDPAETPPRSPSPDSAPPSDEDPLGHLRPEHAALIRGSAISVEVAAERGYRSVNFRAELTRCGFTQRQALVPALLIPIYDSRGEIRLYQSRPNTPRILNGKPIKYETPHGTQMVLDVPLRCREHLGDPKRPLWLTEGARKADAGVTFGLCCVALLGVWSFRGKNIHDGKTALAEWESIALNGRTVYVVFDSDVTTKPQVRGALARLKGFLEHRGASVLIVHLPGGASGAKVGLDDFLAAGGTVDRLVSLAGPDLPRSEEPSAPESPYTESDEGIFLNKETRDGVVPVRLTNFRARIVEEVVRDDGAEQRRSFLIRVDQAGRTDTRPVPAADFSSMSWVSAEFGSAAVLSAGHGVRDHARAAIQILSGPPPSRSVYTHVGWRQIDGRWTYLHAGGGITADGLTGDVSVDLPPALALMRLPAPPTGDELRTAVRASIGLTDLGANGVGHALVAAAYRAPIGPADFSVHLVGPTGVFKTEGAALVAQHFGSEQSARRLAAAWTSTANANEALAFHCKDAPLVVDDFAPAGSATDVQRFHRDADRLFRAQGNSSGRGRLGPDGSFRAVRAPRGLIVSTGEETPHGQSLRARLQLVDVGPQDIDRQRLSEAQRLAGDGVLARAMSGYLRWLAADYDRIRQLHRERVIAIRQELIDSTAHRRTAGIAADLISAFELLLRFATEVGAITAEDAVARLQAAREAFSLQAARQAQHLAAAEPAEHFVTLLASSIASGGSHLCSREGAHPDSPEAHGWRARTVASKSGDIDTAWDSRGRCVGWIDGPNLYLDPNAAHAAAQDLGKAIGNPLSISVTTLGRRLSEKGLLASTDRPSQTLTVRRTLAKVKRRVLHLRLVDVLAPGGGPPTAESADDGFQCIDCGAPLLDGDGCSACSSNHGVEP